MGVDVQELKRRLEIAKTGRAVLDATFDQVEKWVGPLAGGRSTEQLAGEAAVDWQRAEVWDFTAGDGADKLAANLYTAITNPALRWIRLQFLDKKLQQDTEATAWLDDCTDIMFAELAASDFYTEISSFYGDLTRYCTAVFVAEAKKDALERKAWEGLDFTAPPVRECWYEPDAAGNVYRFWRGFSWTASQIVSKFPKKEDGTELVPEHIRRQAEKADEAGTKHPVAFSIWVRPERIGKKKEHPLAPELRPIGCCYFLIESAELLGEEGGYYELPVYVVPWERAAGSDWGHGPGIRVLPTVRYLNARLEATRSAGEKAVDPAIATTERGLMSDLDQNAGGVTVFRSMEDWKPLESGARFDVGEHDIQDLRGMIRGAFWTDELTLKMNPAMTATEVNARLDQMNKLFGPTLARLQSGGLDPMVKLIFAALYRAQRFPKIPGAVEAAITAANGEFTIQYQGPLSRAQRIDEVASIERLASFVAAHVKMGFQKAALTYNEDAAVREVARRLGTPATCLYSPSEVAAKVKAQEQIQARMMQAEAARAEGEAAQQGADALGAVQSTPASPTPLVSPEAGGGLM
jgi:hypothetical protein